MKRIISLISALALILTTLTLSAVSPSAAETATIRAGSKSYTVNVGDCLEYTLTLTYTGKKLATGQIELPFDFSGLSSYSQDELEKFTSAVAPATGASSVVVRTEGNSTIGVNGYVMNFVSPYGFDFSEGKVALVLLFSVEKAGVYDLCASLSQFADVDDTVIVDKEGTVFGTRLSVTESITPAALETPQLSVSTDAGGMRVSWKPVPYATKYRVYYRGRSGWVRFAETAETSVLDPDVSDGGRYTYTVRCVSADGSRFLSDFDRDGEVGVYYEAPVLKPSCAEDAVTLKWDAVDTASKYRVYRRDNNSWTRLCETSALTYTDRNVTSGEEYTYTIRTLNSGGSFLSWFYTDGFKLKFLKAPEFSLSNAADGVTIRWDKVEGAEKYRVFYRGSRGWTRLADTTETSFLDTDVRSDRTYTYTVRCINGDGSAYTSDFRAGKQITYYAAPKLTLSNAEDGVKITWNAIDGAAKYRVYYKGRNGWTKMVDTASTSYLDTDVKSGTNYTYTIRAMDSKSNHLSWFYADGFKIQFVKAPTVTLTNAADGVNISWDAVGGAKLYRVYYYGSKGWTKLTDTTETSFLDTDVRSNRTYTYTVRCLSDDATKFISDYRAGKKITYYAAPKLELSSTAEGVSMKWNAIDGAAKYRVYYKGSSGWTKLTDTAATSFVDKNAKEGVRYIYTIRAMDSKDNHLSWFYTDGFSITYTK